MLFRPPHPLPPAAATLRRYRSCLVTVMVSALTLTVAVLSTLSRAVADSQNGFVAAGVAVSVNLRGVVGAVINDIRLNIAVQPELV